MLISTAAVALALAASADQPKKNPVRYANSTAYCLQGTMADGSYVRSGSVAMNILPLGTRITTSKPQFGLRRFIVRDRIGHGTELDFWTPSCGSAISFGRRTVRYRVGWHKFKSERTRAVWKQG